MVTALCHLVSEGCGMTGREGEGSEGGEGRQLVSANPFNLVLPLSPVFDQWAGSGEGRGVTAE